jgi:PKD-like domain/Bacterial Ig-like domain (group 2)
MKKLFTLLIALFSFLSMSLGQTTSKPILSPATSICVATLPAPTTLGVSFDYQTTAAFTAVTTTLQVQLLDNASTVLSTLSLGSFTFTTDVAGKFPFSTTINLVNAYAGTGRFVRILDGLGTPISISNSNPIEIVIQPTANAGVDLSICQSGAPSAITLGGVIAGGATQGTWSIISGGGTLGNITTPTAYANVTYTPVMNYTGQVILQLTSDNPGSLASPSVCSVASDTRIITVNPLPTLSSVSATAKCAGVGNNMVTVLGLLPGSGNLIYTLNGGSNITIPYTSSAGSFTFPVSGAINDDIVEIKSLTITSTTCIQTFPLVPVALPALSINKVKLVVNPNPAATITPVAPFVCAGTSVTINSSLSTSTTPDYNHSWGVIPVLGLTLVNMPSSPSSSVTFTPTTQGMVNVTYVVTDSKGCAAAQQTAVVTVTDPPLPLSPIAPIEQCDNATFTLTAPSLISQPIGTVGTWSVVSGTLSGSISTPSGSTSTVTLSSPTAVLRYTVINGACGALSTTVTLTNQQPRLTAQPITPICSGTAFIYNPIAPSGASVTWTRTTVIPGISPATSTGGSSPNINEVLTNTNLSPAIGTLVNYAFFVSANGCTATNPEIVTVRVRAQPNVNSFTRSVCSGANVSINPTNSTDGAIPNGTTYSWSAPTLTVGLSVSAGIPILPQVNFFTGNFTNTTASPQTATYSVTPSSIGGCDGTPFDVVVTVNPRPSITTIPITVCSGVPFTVDPVNGTNGVVPASTKYAWSAPSVLGITGAAASPSLPANPAETSITGTLTNTTGSDIVVNYTVSSRSPVGPCTAGSTFTVAVTVKPALTLSNTTTIIPAVCSGSLVSYTPTSAASGATFAWTRIAVSGITEPTTGSSGDINEMLHNTTPTAIPVTYNYTITSLNGCVSPAIPVTVIVKPIPVLNSSLSLTTCSGDVFNYTATSLTVGSPTTNFAWTRAAVTNITPAAPSLGSIANISETLTNLSTAPINVTYVFTTSADGCPGSPQNVVVTVNPTPAVNNLPANICSGDLFMVTPQNLANGAIPVGTTYSWTVFSVTGGITGAAPSPAVVFPALPPTSITGTLTNPSASVGTVTYRVTPNFAGCPGAFFDLLVTVNPKAIITSPILVDACSGTPFTATVAGVFNSTTTTYSWSAPSVPNITGAADGLGASSITGTLVNNTLFPITVTYVVTPTTPTATTLPGTCPGAPFNVVVTVKPSPTISGTLAVCEGGATTQLTGTLLPATFAGMWSSGNTVAATVNSTTGLVTGGTSGVAAGTNVIITYTASNGCPTTATVKVNAKPVISSIPTQTTCSGSQFALIPSVGIIPSGTTYSWSAPTVSSGLTGGVGGIDAGIISGTLANSNNTQGMATYNVIASANTCVAANSFAVNVNVDPKPSITVPAQSICSGTGLTITTINGVGASFNGIVTSGTVYTWGLPTAPGISGLGSGSSTGSFATGILLNSTTLPIDVTYSVTPSIGTCPGAPFDVVVTVKPTPVLAASALVSVCNGGTVTAVLNGTIIPSGTTYVWSGSGGSKIVVELGPLSNLGSSPALQTFLVTPTFNGCPGVAFNVPITVNPTPTIKVGTTTITTLVRCKGVMTQLTGSTAGTGIVTPTWVSSDQSVATVVAGKVTGVNAGTCTITYTDNNGCTTSIAVTINANPTVTVTAKTNFVSQGCILMGVTANVTGGTAPYTINGWSSANAALITFSNLTAFTTNVNASTATVTFPTTVNVNFEANDNNGCVAEASPLVLNLYPALAANVTGANAVCIGGTTPLSSGIAGGNPTGMGTGVPAERTTVWASSNTLVATVSQSGVVTGVAVGSANISVTVTDASGCFASSTKSVIVKAAPALTTVTSNVSCFNSNNGIICLTGQDPTSTYTYLWSNGATSVCNSGLSPTTSTTLLSVLITDVTTSCPLTISNLAITSPSAALSATIGTVGGVTAICQSPIPGTSPLVTFTGSNGTGAYTFKYTINGGLPQTALTTVGNSVTVSVPTGTASSFVYALVDVTSAACNATATGSATITVDASILPAPVVMAGPDQSGLLVNTATLTHSAIPTLPSGLTGTWSVVPANPSVTFTSLNPATATTTVSNLPAGATTLRWTISKGACKVSDDVVVITAPLKVYVTAYLQGPYDSTTLQMKDDLRAGGHLPNTSPYGGLEMVNSSVFSVTGPDAIVDWVQVQLRTSPTAVFKTKPALIQRDGDVVGLDGISPVEFEALDGGYHIAILHRNHLGAMSLGLKSLTLADPLVNQFDFTDNADIGNATFGTNAQKLVDGYRCMWAGDANGNKVIRYNGGSGPTANDRSVILTYLSGITAASSPPGYYKEDINMNGIVRYNGGGNDRSIILSNLGGITSASIVQQF